jgi:hypothetical protein
VTDKTTALEAYEAPAIEGRQEIGAPLVGLASGPPA